MRHPPRSTLTVCISILLMLTACEPEVRGEFSSTESSALAGTGSDNQGRDFWLAFPANYIPNSELTLFITGSTSTSGSVNIPALGSTIPFNVTAGAVTSVQLPTNAQIATNDGIVRGMGIRVTANANVTVYGLNRIEYSTDAYLGLPVGVLGTEYRVMSYSPINSSLGSQFTVVATDASTVVTITPSASLGSRPAGVPYSISLNVGDVYQIHAGADTTGTLVTSNKPIALFGGNRCAFVPVNARACDHLVEQIPPTSAWGTRFVSMPLRTRLNGDTFRLLAAEDGTSISLNGSVVATLNRGQFHERIVNGPALITATKPILVAQYSNGSSFDGVTSDPFMMLIPPYEQFLTGYIISAPQQGFSLNFINVVAPAQAVGSVRLDGQLISASAFTPIGSSGFSGAQLAVSPGSHSLTGPLPFGVHSYGFDSYDSYGYPGGLSLSEVATVTSLTLTPESASNQVGAQQCLVATVLNNRSEPVSDVRVDFTVSGANTATGFATTGANGQAQYCYTGRNAGGDTVRATLSQLSDTSTVSWSSLPPTQLTLTPESATNEVESQQCLVATVLNARSEPVGNVQVSLAITGANTVSRSGTTAANGQVQFCYTGQNPGVDTATATTGSLLDMSMVTWAPLPPAQLTFTPESATNEVESEQCLVATVINRRSQPTGGVQVTFSVAGANSVNGTATTAANGQAQFCYTGQTPGADTVTARTGSLSDTSSVTWTPLPPAQLILTPESTSGEIESQQCLVATVLNRRSQPVGNVRVDFTTAGVHGASGSAVTGANGQVQFCYTGQNTGADTVTASAGSLSDTSSVTWLPLPPAQLLLTPESATNVIRYEQCLVATVLNRRSQPIGNVQVDFAIAGVNTGGASATTAANGEAVFCYTGQRHGLDIVTAAAGSLSDTSRVTWTRAPSESWTLTARLEGCHAKALHHSVRLQDGRVLTIGGYNTKADLYDPESDTWASTGSALATHRYHTATLLRDGRVLVTGGVNGSHSTMTEVYDPALGTWSRAASMLVARRYHSATLLPDGRVLVAGGGASSQATSAEIYDPASNSWALTGSLSAGRYGHTASLLQDNRILLAGGQNTSGQSIATAEVYDPTPGTWASTGNMNQPRRYHTATLLPNGKVLVTGGADSSALSSTAELYDPASGRWESTGSMLRARRYHTATLLPTGKVLATGGYDSFWGILTAAELYDPATGSWRFTASMNVDRYYHTATALEDGRVLVIGGFSNGDQGSVEFYTP
jgi:hypothetical protein